MKNVSKGGVMDGLWGEIEEEIVACLQGRGAIPPSEVGRRLGISEGSAVSLLSILARRGKIRICLVELPAGLDGAAVTPDFEVR